MFKRKSLRVTTLVAVLLASFGCGDGDGFSQVVGDVLVVNAPTQGLVAGQILSINGTYGDNCMGRQHGSSWSLAVTRDAPLDYPQLSVREREVGCALTLTGLKTQDGLFDARPAITLSASYATIASTFVRGESSFVVNAMLSTTTFDTDFTLTVLFGEDPPDGAGGIKGDAVGTISVSAGSVPAPDYRLGMEGVLVESTGDNVVGRATGNAALTASGQRPDSRRAIDEARYVVVADQMLQTYAQIDAAYRAGDAANYPTLPMGSALHATPIDAVAFDVEGATLPQVRKVIIANSLAGVRSYQVLTVIFAAPSMDGA